VNQEAAGWRLRTYESLASTSDLCRTLAAAGEPEGLAVLARRQTAGRGSRGREWLSEPGNLFVSYLIRPSDRPADAGMWALLAGLAAAESLDHPGIVLKWPNDLLFGGAKLGGILIDCATTAEGQLDWLVIGIGINLTCALDIEGRAVISLGSAIPPDMLATRIADSLSYWRRVRLLEGWGAIRTAWLARATPIGQTMTLRQGETVVGGRFAGLGEDGSLLLQTGGRVHAFSSGEIWLENNGC